MSFLSLSVVYQWKIAYQQKYHLVFLAQIYSFSTITRNCAKKTQSWSLKVLYQCKIAYQKYHLLFSSQIYSFQQVTRYYNNKCHLWSISVGYKWKIAYPYKCPLPKCYQKCPYQVWIPIRRFVMRYFVLIGTLSVNVFLSVILGTF